MPRTISVNRIRDFNSGILKQFPKVLMMFWSMRDGGAPRLLLSGWRRRGSRSGDDLAGASLAFDLRPGRRAEGVGDDGQLARQLAVAKNLHTLDRPVGEARLAQRGDIHLRPIGELVQGIEIHSHVAGRVARIVETPLRDAADERDLAALEPNADGTARACGLALAAAAGSFAVAARFTLAQAFAPMLGARAGFEVV